MLNVSSTLARAIATRSIWNAVSFAAMNCAMKSLVSMHLIANIDINKQFSISLKRVRVFVIVGYTVFLTYTSVYQPYSFGAVSTICQFIYIRKASTLPYSSNDVSSAAKSALGRFSVGENAQSKLRALHSYLWRTCISGLSFQYLFASMPLIDMCI